MVCTALLPSGPGLLYRAVEQKNYDPHIRHASLFSREHTIAASFCSIAAAGSAGF